MPLSFHGAGGTDSLLVVGTNAQWTMTGDGNGTVAGVTFTSVEHRVGDSAMNDTFTFLSLASVTGLVEGGSGDGADTLNFNFTTDQQLTQTLTGEGQGTVEGGIASLAYGGMDGDVVVPTASVVSGGTLAPGNSPGTDTYAADLDLAAEGLTSVEIEVQGTAGDGVDPNGHDTIEVAGTAILSGELDVVSLAPYDPVAATALGDSFTFLTANEIQGDFDSFKGLDLGGGKFWRPTIVGATYVLEVTEIPFFDINPGSDDSNFYAMVSGRDVTPTFAGTTEIVINGQSLSATSVTAGLHGQRCRAVGFRCGRHLHRRCHHHRHAHRRHVRCRDIRN